MQISSEFAAPLVPAASDGSIAVTVIVVVILLVVGLLLYLTLRGNRASAAVPPDPAPALPQPVPSRSPHAPAVPSSPGVTVIQGDKPLRDAYRQLRQRPGVELIQAIWAAEYEDFNIQDYFNDERAWLRAHQEVRFERIVAQKDHHIEYLREMAADHGNLRLASTNTPLQFELYLCEYSEPVPHLAGVLVVTSALSRRPGFGVLLDGSRDGNLTQFGYTLREWFTSIPTTPIAGSRRAQNVWNANAPAYDQYVDRDSTFPFLRDFIRQEDLLLEELIARQSDDVTVLEFGSGTGRTLTYLSERPDVARKIRLYIGIDHSIGMIERSQGKRRSLNRTIADRTYFFTLDGALASKNFWGGQMVLSKDLNDDPHLQTTGLIPEIYRRTDKVICCLLNTLGVVDAATRESMLRNMIVAAAENDVVVLSAFDARAFADQARPLYMEVIPRLVGGQVTPESFDDNTAEFKAGYYYSHWFHADEIDRLIERAGGVTVEHRPIESEGMPIGHFVILRRGE